MTLEEKCSMLSGMDFWHTQPIPRLGMPAVMVSDGPHGLRKQADKRGHAWTFMCSYNKLNGEYASQHKWLLTDLLRKEWGFDGYVMSDWGAVSDRIKGVEAGLDLEMPGSSGERDRAVLQAVQEGRLDEKYVDQAVERILDVNLRYLNHA